MPAFFNSNFAEKDIKKYIEQTSNYVQLVPFNFTCRPVNSAYQQNAGAGVQQQLTEAIKPPKLK